MTLETPARSALLSRARALGLLGASSALALPGVARAQSGPPIRIGTVAADTYAEGLYAYEAGFFSRAGLNVDMKVFPGSGAVAVAAAGNALDVGLTDAIVLSNAVNRGVPLAAIAGCGLYRPGKATSFLCVGRNAPYKTAKDFEGQAIAVVTLVSISRIAVEAWLAKSGADVSTVRFVEMPFPEMPAAIQHGRVAGGFIAEPTISQLPPDVKILADAYRAIGDRFLISNWFSTRDWVAQNPQAAQRLVHAIAAAAAWANDHHDVTAPMLAKYAKLDPSRVRSMLRCPYLTTPLQPGLLQPVIDAGVRYKAIDRAVSAAAIIARVP